MTPVYCGTKSAVRAFTSSLAIARDVAAWSMASFALPQQTQNRSGRLTTRESDTVTWSHRRHKSRSQLRLIASGSHGRDERSHPIRVAKGDEFLQDGENQPERKLAGERGILYSKFLNWPVTEESSIPDS